MIKLSKVKILVGNKKIEKKTLLPYDEKIFKFLSDFSNRLNNFKDCKKFPDILTLAFFCRKANLLNLKRKFLVSLENKRLPLGLIFHITPSNIPTNFAYSLIFGLINGNSNIVKVPSKNFEQVEIISKVMNQTLKKYNEIKKMITIVKYNNEDRFTEEISKKCDARLIWGGDNSIKNIRKFELNSRAFDLTFADRYSICIIDSDQLVKVKQDNLKSLTQKFYNDTFTADQNACSSPHLILWKGDKNKRAQNIFWNSLNNIVEKKYDLTHTASVDKYTELCKKIIQDPTIKKFKTYSNNIYVLNLNNLSTNLDSYRGKWGFFYQYNIKKINEIEKYINKKFQTLTYFGLEKKEIEKFIFSNKLQGIDRVVPIGQALDIGFFWDGYDINNILTRVVDLK
tara:strand:+ start:384 stop:1574 length:1191 start_codon:yes stop_codon:yes gene_type:complete